MTAPGTKARRNEGEEIISDIILGRFQQGVRHLSSLGSHSLNILVNQVLTVS